MGNSPESIHFETWAWSWKTLWTRGLVSFSTWHLLYLTLGYTTEGQHNHTEYLNDIMNPLDEKCLL